jgi:hypothetical protein
MCNTTLHYSNYVPFFFFKNSHAAIPYMNIFTTKNVTHVIDHLTGN